MSDLPRAHIPVGTDPEAVNAAILRTAEQSGATRIHVDYELQGDDIVTVHPDGTIEVVDDGSPTV